VSTLREALQSGSSVLLVLIGFAAGALVALLIARARAARRIAAISAELTTEKARAARVEGFVRDLARAEEDAARLRNQIGFLSVELATERARVAKTEVVERELARVEEELTQLRVKIAELTATLNAEREHGREKLQVLLDAKQALTDQFKSLANEVLEEKTRSFTEQNDANLNLMLGPLKEKITSFQTKVEAAYDSETRNRTVLKEQVRHLIDLNRTLSDDAKNLTRALMGSSKAQGAWGELVLENILQRAGLRKGEEYEVQESHDREDGRRAVPDVVIRLPSGRDLVVDSKVSLAAYAEFESTGDKHSSAAARGRHLDSVRAHIAELSQKNYQALYNIRSLDFVLMFVPVEPAFILAVTQDRDLVMDAYARNVLLVSPSTFMFVIGTVAHLWRQEAQNRNNLEIAKRGAELYDRLCAFVADLQVLGTRLGQARDSYNSAVAKLSTNRGNVIRQAEMLRELGVKPSKALPPSLVNAALGDDHHQRLLAHQPEPEAE
jgi:DNA recombination protein RmuC